VPAAVERRHLHEQWVERVVLPALGGLSHEQRDLARKILLRKRDVKLVAHRPRKWDADRRLELLTDYELLRDQGFKSAEAHRLLQDLHGTSKIPTYLREARKLFPEKRPKRKRARRGKPGAHL
jgi:hypothetical protein